MAVTSFSLSFREVTRDDSNFFQKLCTEKLSILDRPRASIMNSAGYDTSLKTYIVYYDRIICGLLSFRKESSNSITIYCLKQINKSETGNNNFLTTMLGKVLAEARAISCTEIRSLLSKSDREGQDFFQTNSFHVSSSITPPQKSREDSSAEEVVWVRRFHHSTATTTSQAPQSVIKANTSKRSLGEEAPATKRTRREEGPVAEREPRREVPPEAKREELHSFRTERRAPTTSFQGQSSLNAPFVVTLKEPYLSQIQRGEKTVEGRIAAGMFRRISSGNLIRFFNHNHEVTCRVVSVKQYRSFEEMLKSEGFSRCIPGARSLEEAVRVYDTIPGYTERARQNGVLAIQIERM